MGSKSTIAMNRATSDTTVFEKYCEKIHYIAPNIYCCGAGTAADTEHTTAMIASKLELHRLDTVRWIFLKSELGSACLKSNLTALPWTHLPGTTKQSYDLLDNAEKASFPIPRIRISCPGARRGRSEWTAPVHGLPSRIYRFSSVST